MNQEKIVKYSNIVGIISILLLIYWVFSYISIEVFGLKIFRENMTQTFYMSIFGILALMAGTLMLNIMMNLTRIASKHNADEPVLTEKIPSKRLGLYFALSFPFLFGILFLFDQYSAHKKKKYMIAAAEYLLKDYPRHIDTLANYHFTKDYMKQADRILSFLSQTDEKIPTLVVIAQDSLNGARVFLRIHDDYSYRIQDTIPIYKKDFMLRASKEEKIYLKNCFDATQSQIRFTAHDGNYELYYPYLKNGRKVVLYFSDYMRYGK
jgi:hypothetical protein